MTYDNHNQNTPSQDDKKTSGQDPHSNGTGQQDPKEGKDDKKNDTGNRSGGGDQEKKM